MQSLPTPLIQGTKTQSIMFIEDAQLVLIIPTHDIPIIPLDELSLLIKFTQQSWRFVYVVRFSLIQARQPLRLKTGLDCIRLEIAPTGAEPGNRKCNVKK